jgi:ketosteroid isomerase-like protein
MDHGRDPLEVVRRCFAAWDRGDLEGVLAEYAEDVVVEAAFEGTFEGKGSVRGLFAEVFDSASFTNDDLELTADGVTVLAIVRLTGAGVRSGTPMDAPFGYLFRVEDGLVRRVVFYPDVDAARAALGGSSDG